MNKIQKFLLPGYASILSFSALAQVMTVRGPISADEMGRTLIHEHVMVDWIGADSTGYHRWDKSEVVARALPFLEAAKENGVSTFLDCTPAYLGRDPWVLQELSKATGIHILTNTGYYGAGDNKFIPKHALEGSADSLADLWIREFTEGIDGSQIKPGFIKISVAPEHQLSALHKKLVEAAALTHLATGLTIVSHTGPDAPAMAQIELLNEMGVSPTAFVWTHAQMGTLEGYLQAASRGAWISLDNVKDEAATNEGQPGKIAWYVATLSKLKAGGVLNHVLISHDSGWYNVGSDNGGEYDAYTDIFTKLIPELLSNGFTQDDINLLLKDNPKNAFALKVRRL
jgi:phosphotriesterase-related protein